MISDQTLDSFLFTADAATTNSSFKQTFFKYKINLLNFSGKSLKTPMKEFLFGVWPTVCNFPKKQTLFCFKVLLAVLRNKTRPME